MSEKLKVAIKILKSLNQPDRVINRDRINFTKFMDIIGNPFEKFKSIHITGTNGKGSVSIKTAKILQNAGYTVGLYTSPHLFTFRERIQVNGELINKQQISDYIIKIDQISNKNNVPLSFFQYMTAAGFLHFKQRKCDYVALEVGLGGKNDTTNIVNPQISIITSIGLDHTDLLGPTLSHIALQKSGIIKKQRPVVLGPLAEGYEAIDSAIKQKKCKVFKTNKQEYDSKDFQSQNRIITIESINALKYCNPKLVITQDHIKSGLESSQPCRMQLLQQKYAPKWGKSKNIYFDVGHNPSALIKVRQILEKKGYKKEEINFVFGTSKGKKFDESLAEIQKISNHIYLIQANHHRACPINQLQSYIGMSKYPSKYRCITDGNIARTLEYVIADPHPKVVVISGSFFIMPQAKSYFDPSVNQCAEQNINQIYQLKQKIQSI